MGTSFRSRIRSFRYAFTGWWYVIRTQKNAWIHALFSIAVLFVALLLRIPPRDFEKLKLDTEFRRALNDSFLLCYTGVTRRADSILREQENNIKERMNVLREIKQMALQARKDLESGDFDAFGSLLHQSWELKKKMADSISNGRINEIYKTAKRAGAMGGKITGAGAGGFLLLYVPYERQPGAREALRDLQELPFRLEPDGSKVILN